MWYANSVFNFSCQQMKQTNVKKSMVCNEMDDKSSTIQSHINSLNSDIKKLTSE